MGFLIKTPSPVFNGKRAGIAFNKGQATITEADAGKLDVFREMGFEIIELKPETSEAEAAPIKKRTATKKRGE